MGLKFKGEKPKKKRSKLTSLSARQPESDQALDQDLSGWVSAPSPSLLLGPSYITLPPTSLNLTRVCLAIQPTTGKVYPFQLSTSTSTSTTRASTSELAHLDPEELEALVEQEEAGGGGGRDDDLAPQDVNHVWVCTRIPDANDKVTFRSGSGKFLASDELGQLSADREARGQQEEWIIESSTCSTSSEATGEFVLKNMYGKYLGLDLVAGGKLELRCDGEEEGETERWRISMQAEFVAKAKKQFNERNGIKTKEAEDGGRGNGLTIVGDLSAQERENM